MFLKKAYILHLLIAFAFITNIKAQEGCYTCDLDSLKAELQIAKSPEEKFKLLKWIVDFEPTVDSANYFIDQLLQLNNKFKEIDEAPYLLLKSGNEYKQKNDNESALQLYHEAVDLFDLQHKKIPNLLLGFRNIYNLINKQEERYIYYKSKLDYYLANGPFENTASCYHCIAGYYTYTADYNQAISYYLRGSDVYKQFYPYWYYNALGIVGIYYAEWGNYEKGLAYINFALPKIKATRTILETANGYYEYQLAQIKFDTKKYNEVLQHADIIINTFRSDKENRFYSIGLLYKALALLEFGDTEAAYPLLTEAKNFNEVAHEGRMTTFNSTLEIDFGLYYYYNSIKQYALAEVHLLEGYKKAVAEQTNKLQLKYLKLLGDVSAKQNKYVESRGYTEAHTALSNKLDAEFSKFKIAQYENEQKQIEQLHKINQLQAEQSVQQLAISRRNTILYFSLGALLIIVVFLVIIYRQLQANKKTLTALIKTQKQLIQSEKMASLGELTAGIAHEIQNPLNFVNNFSEVSAELVDEIQEARNKNQDKIDIELENEILEDIKQNLEKITLHGKRADAIVKGMLEHSKRGSGQKEETDINVLAEEFLRLSFQSFLAKDQDFRVELEINLDHDLPKISVIPQDIGKVLLNLYSNAFYACAERSRSAVAEKANTSGSDYIPQIKVSTKQLPPQSLSREIGRGKGGHIEISVSDNGSGIPSSIKDKIFQPFFTTKPTGQGTGLGLSLSYDIVKAHGGELKVETKEGEGSEFIIHLPNSFHS